MCPPSELTQLQGYVEDARRVRVGECEGGECEGGSVRVEH